MASQTKINWAESTFNPWEGCTKITSGCDHCYAEGRDARHLVDSVCHWGKGAPRRLTSESNWQNPVVWNRKAETGKYRQRVFCGSLCDWADAEAPEGALARLWELIRTTPNLDWLLLSKRPNRIAGLLPGDWNEGYSNAWLGVSVENRAQGLNRIDILRDIPAVRRFISFEPLLEDLGEIDLRGIAWAIVGGESGNNARVFRVEWAESILRQCREQGTAPWIKQLGKNPEYLCSALKLEGPQGEDWEQWPGYLDHLKVRELPNNKDAGPDVQPYQHEARRRYLDTALAALAHGLEPEPAEVERGLRSRFLGCERAIFLNRREKAEILNDYKDLYGPKRKWSAFLKIIGMPPRTSYDLLKLVQKPEVSIGRADCAESAQSGDGETLEYGFDLAVDKAVKYLNRLFKSFTAHQREQALNAVRDRVEASTELKKAA
jgi:protein gp37